MRLVNKRRSKPDDVNHCNDTDTHTCGSAGGGGGAGFWGRAPSQNRRTLKQLCSDSKQVVVRSQIVCDC